MEIILNPKQTKALKRICKASWDDLLVYGDEYALDKDSTKKFIFKDNGADVLMVAHTDSVYPPENLYDLNFNNKRTIMCATLDDRLGVFTICEYLPSLLGDNVYDILLTDGEEKGRSTAMYFEPPRQYNWIVEFDRHGDDLVFYQYGGNTDAVRELKKSGFKIGIGSFSDIAELDHCDATAFNVGVGYYDEHSPMAYMVVDEYLSQIKHFVHFWHLNKDTYFPFIKSLPVVANYRYLSQPYANPYRYDDTDDDLPEVRFVDTKNDINIKSKSLDPKTWNAWYVENDSEKRGICEICDEMLPVKKISDVYVCKDCAFLFQLEIAEYEDYTEAKKAQELKELEDDVWNECDGCSGWFDTESMAFIDLNDGLGEQLFCKVCCAKHGSNYKIIPITHN
jgi:hypothetical protein